MSTEKLIIELDAKTQKLESALNRVEKDLRGVEKQTDKSDGALKKFNNGAKVAAEGATKLAAAGLALATAITAIVLASASSERELRNLAATAGTSKEDFEALSFAMKQYGLDAKGTSDAMNDMSERVAEFAIAGTGAMQDFFDAMKMSKDESRAYAQAIEHLTGEEITQKLVNDMQDAGVSAGRMNFALKSLTNDLSYSTAAFIDNGKAVKELKATYAAATSQLKLTNAEIDGLQGVATSFDLMTNSMSKAGTLISAQLAPLLNEFFGGVIDVVPTATQAIVDFINTFKSADEIKSIDSMTRLIDKQKQVVRELRLEQNALGKTWDTALDSKKSLSTQYDIINLQIKEEEERITSLIDARDKLTESERLAAIQKAEAGEIGGSFDPNATGGSSSGGTGDEIQAIIDRNKTEEDLLYEKLQRELGLVGDNNELQIQLKQDYAIALMDIDNELTEFELDNLDRLSKAEKDAENRTKRSNNAKLQLASQYTTAASALNSALFEDNKAIGAGVIIADTAVAMGKANALGYPAAIPAMIAAAASGAAALASLKSASKGGGSVSAPSATPPPPPPPPSPKEEDELSTIDVNAQDVSGESRSFTVKFEGIGDELTEVLAKNMKIMEFNGELEL
jgi:exonuclease VII small subunit